MTLTHNNSFAQVHRSIYLINIRKALIEIQMQALETNEILRTKRIGSSIKHIINEKVQRLGYVDAYIRDRQFILALTIYIGSRWHGQLKNCLPRIGA